MTPAQFKQLATEDFTYKPNFRVLENTRAYPIQVDYVARYEMYTGTSLGPAPSSISVIEEN